jgi:hypothetical protein
MDPEANPYQPPAADPTPVENPAENPRGSGPDLRIKDPRSWGWAAITFIWINCLSITLQWFMPPHPVWQAILAISILLSVVSAIVSYVVWIFRVATNARIIHPTAGPSPGWAIGCHFIPFVNWIVPAMVMKEIADATFRLRSPGGIGYVVAVWWTSFVLRGFVQAFQPASPFLPVLNWIAGIGAAWLIVRISLKQSDWREAGLPAETRPAMVPAGGPRPVTAGGIPAARPVPIARPQPVRKPEPTVTVVDDDASDPLSAPGPPGPA